MPLMPASSMSSALCRAVLSAGLLLSPVTAALAQQSRIISGDWVAGCVEKFRDGAPVVYCDRFGGFVTNTYPPGCDGNAAFYCSGMDLCTLATYVAVIDTDDYYRLQSEIEDCDGPVMQPLQG